MPIDPDLYPLFSSTVVIENPLPITNYTSPTTSGVPPVTTASPVLDIYGRHANPLPDGTTNTSAAVWTAPKTYKCRLEYGAKIIIDEQGRERVSSGRAYLMGVFPEVTTESRVTLTDETHPGERYPILISVTTDNDELGPHNTTINFA